jgi:hypothetical protein
MKENPVPLQLLVLESGIEIWNECEWANIFGDAMGPSIRRLFLALRKQIHRFVSCGKIHARHSTRQEGGRV